MARGTSTRIVADGVIGVSGKPTRLYGLLIESGATPGLISVYNGTDTTGTVILPSLSGAANQGKVVEGIPAEGIFFPGGVYVDIDANTTSVIAQWETVSVT